MAASPPDSVSPQVQQKPTLPRMFSRRKSSKKGKEVEQTPPVPPSTEKPPPGGEAGENTDQAAPQPPVESVQNGDTADSEGITAAGDESAEQGQAPTSSPPLSSTPPPPPPAAEEEAAPAPEPVMASTSTTAPLPTEPAHTDEADKDKDRDKDKGSLSTTLTGTQTHAQTRSSRRKVNKSSTSEGALSASSTNGDKVTAVSSHPSAKKTTSSSAHSKQSFISRLVRKLVPCVGTSHIDVDDGASKASDPGSSLALKEKQGAKEPEKDSRPPQDPQTTGEAASDDPPADASSSAPLTVPPLAITPSTATTPPDAEVLLPPTPTKLLPQSETEGVTSGAVQPPGSTGEEVAQDHSRAHSHDSGDESDGTSFTEDEEVEENSPMDDVEDEEDRLIMSGGAGIPIGPDGDPRPLLPPIAPQHVGRKCLVLDLDETLVHSSFKSIQQADYVVPVEIEYHWHNVYVIKRPGVDNFLKKMGEIYEVVVFTASLSKYADPVLDKLDIHQVVSHRLFRESCYNHKGNYVKDLSQLGRPIADTIILDNSPASYIFHPNNAVPVSSWFNDPHDTELTDLCPFLADLGAVDDVRGVLDGGL